MLTFVVVLLFVLPFLGLIFIGQGWRKAADKAAEKEAALTSRSEHERSAEPLDGT